MTQELRMYNQAGELYLSALRSAWRREKIEQPSLWLTRDPAAEDKMLRNDVIGHAVNHRCMLIAGRAWNLVPKRPNDPMADLAVAVGTDLVKKIRKFAEARRQLARAFFHGARYATIKTAVKWLDLGDGVMRQWVVPIRLQDENRFRYRKRVRDPHGPNPRAYWEKHQLLGGDGDAGWKPVSRREAIGIIGHVYDDTEETLGYGKGLREALGYPWYALTHCDQEALGAIERYARGWVQARIDKAAHADTGLPNTEVVSKWLTLIEKMQARHAMVLGKDDEIEIAEPSGTGWQMVDRHLDRLEGRVRTLVLSGNLPTAASEGGSYALSNTQENSTEMVVQFDRLAMEEVLSDDLMQALWWFNHANMVELGIQDLQPEFAVTQEKMENPTEVAATAETMNRMGADIASEDLYKRTGFRKPEAEEDVIPGKREPAAAAMGGDPFGFGIPPTLGPAMELPSPEPVSSGAPDEAQDTALNGAQVTAATEIVEKVTNGQLPPGAAKAMLVSMFNLPEDVAAGMIEDAARFTPAPDSEPQPLPAAPPPREQRDPVRMSAPPWRFDEIRQKWVDGKLVDEVVTRERLRPKSKVVEYPREASFTMDYADDFGTGVPS